MNKINLALVDDSETDLTVLKIALESSGCYLVTHVFLNGCDLIQFLNERPLNVDVVLLDYNMPILNGLETYRNLTQRKLNFKILLMSHGYFPEVMQQMTAMGTQNYCFKSPEAIMDAISRVMSGRTIYDNFVAINAWDGNSRQKGLQSADELPWRRILSPLDRKIIQYICHGLNSRQIAFVLGYETSSIEKYRGQILAQLELTNSQELASWAMANGLMTSAILFKLRQDPKLKLAMQELKQRERHEN